MSRQRLINGIPPVIKMTLPAKLGMSLSGLNVLLAMSRRGCCSSYCCLGDDVLGARLFLIGLLLRLMS